MVQCHCPFHRKRQYRIIPVTKFMHLHKADRIVWQEINLCLCIFHNLLHIFNSRILRCFNQFLNQLFCFLQIIQFISMTDSQIMCFPAKRCMSILRTADNLLHLNQSRKLRRIHDMIRIHIQNIIKFRHIFISFRVFTILP